MAKIIDNSLKRKIIRLSSDDVLSIVREYQNLVFNQKKPDEIRNILENYNFYLPTDI